MTMRTATLAGRRAALRAMLDTCTVREVTATTVDPLTGAGTPTYVTLYTGACKVQTSEAQESTPEAGGSTHTVQRYAVHVPVGSFAPKVGHVVTVTVSPLDPNLVGRQFRVIALLHKTAATAYRLAVEEVA